MRNDSMQEFQTRKADLTQCRIIDTDKPTINDGEVIVKIDRFAFTANNITYAAMGDHLQYWQFFPPHGDDAEKWGIIPVWGFADVIESNHDEIIIGERLFGYFLPANELVIKPNHITPSSLSDGSAHRAKLPPSYNRYQRVNHEPGYNRAHDNQRALLAVLQMTAFCLYNLLKSNDWFGSEQVVIVSASSKTSIGLAYGLTDALLNKDANAPSVVGVTSQHHLDFVHSINAYDSVLSYASLEQIDANKPTVIVDMSANAEVLSRLHQHLGDNMRFTSNVGLTHWDEPRDVKGIIRDRSEQFFVPTYIEKVLKELGAEKFGKRSLEYIAMCSEKTNTWLTIKEIDGVKGLEQVYKDVCDDNISADEGLVVVM